MGDAVKKSKDKWIKKALDTLGFEWSSEDSCDSIQDIKDKMQGQISLRQEMLDIKSKTDEAIEMIDQNIDNLQILIDQVEIEQIKAKNPKAKEVFKI